MPQALASHFILMSPAIKTHSAACSAGQVAGCWGGRRYNGPITGTTAPPASGWSSGSGSDGGFHLFSVILPAPARVRKGEDMNTLTTEERDQVRGAVQDFLRDDLFELDASMGREQFQQQLIADVDTLQARHAALRQSIGSHLPTLAANSRARAGEPTVRLPVGGENRDFMSWTEAMVAWADWYAGAIRGACERIQQGWGPLLEYDGAPDGPTVRHYRPNRKCEEVWAEAGLGGILKTFRDDRRQFQVQVEYELLRLDGTVTETADGQSDPSAGQSAGQRPPNKGQKVTWQEAKEQAERHVKRNGWPGQNALMRLVGCGKETIRKAIKESSYLRARQAEHGKQKEVGKRAVQLGGGAFDAMEQSREPDPTLDALIAEQKADEAREERQHKATKRSRSRGQP